MASRAKTYARLDGGRLQVLVARTLEQHPPKISTTMPTGTRLSNILATRACWVHATDLTLADAKFKVAGQFLRVLYDRSALRKKVNPCLAIMAHL